MADEATIAANVARLRLDRRLTQEDLAAKAGLSRVALGKIERGGGYPESADPQRFGKGAHRSGRRTGDSCPASRKCAVPGADASPCA